jgi:hypothetical protein
VPSNASVVGGQLQSQAGSQVQSISVVDHPNASGQLHHYQQQQQLQQQQIQQYQQLQQLQLTQQQIQQQQQQHIVQQHHHHHSLLRMPLGKSKDSKDKGEPAFDCKCFLIFTHFFGFNGTFKAFQKLGFNLHHN